MAQQRAAGETAAMTREDIEAEIQLRNEAVEAGMRGEALYSFQAQAAEDAITRKINDGKVQNEAGLRSIEDLKMQLHNAQMKRLEQEEYETRRMQAEAAQAGLTGIAKIQAEGQSQVDELSAPDKNFVNENNKQAQRVALEQKTDQLILDEQQKFQDEMSQIGQRSDRQQESGYARIEEEAKASLARIAKAYEASYGKLDPFSPDQAAMMLNGALQAEVGVTNVFDNAQRERVELTKKNDEQVAQVEMQAARLSLPPWQQAQQQIIDEYQQRVQKAKELLDQENAYFAQKQKEQGTLTQEETAEQQAVWAQYYRVITADAQLANAQMQKQAEQSRDQIAGQLQSMFDNPAKYMENRAKQMMFDILANWVQQLMQFNGTAGGILGGILGTNSKAMSTSSNPLEAIGSVFGMHMGHSGTAGAASPMTSMGSTLSSAGSTLSSSGTMLASSATQLSSAATALMSASQAMSGGGAGSTGAGPIGQITSMLGGPGGIAGGLGGGAGLDSAISSLPESGDNLSGANSLFNDAASTVGMASPSGGLTGGSTGTAGSIGQMTSMLSSITSTSSAPLLNPTGAMQPTDLPPTSSSGVLGTVPDDSTGTGATADGGGSSLGAGLGMGMAALGGGIALAQDWQSGNTLGAVVTGGMTGASIGMMAGGPIGMAIGAGIGALVGFIGSLFSDHGYSKAVAYNRNEITPAIQKEMWGYNAGNIGYQQAEQDLTNLQSTANAQTKSWGSGAMQVYRNQIVPEIQAALTQVNNEQMGGRSNVTMSAAQFDSGGPVTSFGDLSTGPFSGFIHARMGERVMNPMASMMHAPLLDAMNSGPSALSRMRRSAPMTGGGGGGETHQHFHFQTMDAKSMDYWLRNGGAQTLQAGLNQNVRRYGGKALG